MGRHGVVPILCLLSHFGCRAQATPPAILEPSPDVAPIPTAPSAATATLSLPRSCGMTARVAAAANVGAPRMGAAEARTRLDAPLQSSRDEAAAALRAAIAQDPSASGDPGKVSWNQRLAALPRDTTKSQFEQQTGATGILGTAGMGGKTVVYQLDDFWTATASFGRGDTLTHVGDLARRPRQRSVEPPSGYAGPWVVYFVDGAVAQQNQYAAGQLQRRCEYGSDGQLSLEQHYVGGKLDGVERGFYADGKRSEEGSYREGKRSGRWVHWYPSGLLQQEESLTAGVENGPFINWRDNGTRSSRIDYRDGKETGQAAWDMAGKLLYARGTAARDLDASAASPD